MESIGANPSGVEIQSLGVPAGAGAGRRPRAAVAAWGFTTAGVALFGSSAMAADAYSIGVLASVAFLTSALAWKLDRRASQFAGWMAAAGYLYLQSAWPRDSGIAEAVRAATGSVGILALSVAVSEARHLLQSLTQATMVDRVTQLANRELLLKLIQLESFRAARHRLTFCVVVLDFPCLEREGGNRGYGWTETMLMSMAEGIADTIRKSDVLGRISEFRFGLLLPMVDMDGANAAIERLDAAMRIVPLLAGHSFDEGMSAGVAGFPADGYDAAALLTIAERRLRPVRVEGTSASTSPVTAAAHVNCAESVLDGPPRRY